MKSLQGQIIWKIIFVVFISFFLFSLILLNFIDKNVDRITYVLVPTLLILVYLFLRSSYKNIYNPVSLISENMKEALIQNWAKVKKVDTKISELAELEKYTEYLLETLRNRGRSEEFEKIYEVKNIENKFRTKHAVGEVEKFKLAVDSAPDIIVIVDKFGYINYANKTLTDFIGMGFSEVENKKITDLWHKEDDVNVWKKNYEKVFKEKKPVTFSSWGLKKDNLKFEASISISPIKNDGMDVENFLVVERDVSEERQKERTKSEFISVVSHELRTPMTIIRGYSTLLSEGKLGEVNEKQKEYIDKINSETGVLLELANDMLDLQKFESGKIELKFERTNIPKFIEKIIGDFTMDYSKKGFTLELENNLSKEYADIDLKYFERVITNMLTNSYKYMEHGGVKIFLVNPDPDNIVIAVKDTGVGIKEEALPHIFERFYQADNVMSRKQQGTGLGLSIVKTVTQAHGGMVWVESKEGVGTTFYINLPVSN